MTHQSKYRRRAWGWCCGGLLLGGAGVLVSGGFVAAPAAAGAAARQERNVSTASAGSGSSLRKAYVRSGPAVVSDCVSPLARGNEV